jgi:hypothetical protein
VLQCLEQEQEAMDPKVIEMNNLRVLHDYLNQTLDVLVRGQRFGASQTPGLGYSPFAAPIAGTPGPIGTDTVYGPGPWGFGASPVFNGISPFPATNPFTGHPLQGYGPTAYSPFGSWTSQPWGPSQPWTQSPWAPQGTWTGGQSYWPAAEAARQAQVNQALAAKQSVLEQMCRVAGIPV